MHSLKLLEKTHKGKIDCIYIDPPYNTEKKDFIYNDTQIAETDDYKHSKWLSFMEKRLTIARTLLSDTGFILISIDDNEQPQLKLLCDDIFGEKNFGVNIIINRPSEIASTFHVSKHEYMLMYTKNINLFTKTDKEKTRYVVSRGTIGNEKQSQPIIEFPSGLNCYGIKDGIYKETRKVENSKENIENLDDIVVENGKLKFPIKLKARWRASNDMRNFFKNNCLPTKAKISGEIVEIYFENDRFIPQIKKATSNKISSLFLENKKGSNELASLGLNFNFPKSTHLIKEILKQANIGKEITVLDFFAGSGTTAQAVLELNEEDNGNRKFILCTNNENNICREITYERIKTVITGIKKDNTKYSDGIPANLKYLKTNLIPKDTEDLEDELLEVSIPLIELENFISLDNKNIKVIFNEEDLEIEIKNINKNTKVFYIAEDIILSNTQKEILIKNNIELKRIPKYYYKNEM